MTAVNLEPKPSRDKLLESGGEFTISELIDFSLGEEVSPGARRVLYVDDIVPVRLIPLELSLAAEEFFFKDADIKSTLQILRFAYCFYRSCVNRRMEVPLAQVEGGWEWLQPANFPWTDFDAVKLMAFAIEGGREVDTPLAITYQGSTEDKFNFLTGKVTRTEVSDLRSRPNDVVKFKVRKLGDIRMVNQMAWQQFSNKVFANGLLYAIEDIEKGVADTNKLKDLISFLFKDLRESVRMPVLRYAKFGETPSGENLLINSF